MRSIDPASATALMGSRSGDKLICHAWYGGKLTYPNLPVSAWGLTWDDTAQIKGALTLTVTDDTNKLTPWLLEDPLGVGGAEIQVLYQIGGAGTVNVGWFRIVQNQPVEAWRTYTVRNVGAVNTGTTVPPGQSITMVPAGSTITLTAHDRTENAVHANLLAPESPGAGATVTSEAKRLLDGIMRVTVAAGVTDASVASSVVYARDRLNEVENLLTNVQATHRMTGDGAFEIYPITPQTPVWTIQGGDEGALVTINHGTDNTQLYNTVVSDGTQTATKSDGTQVQLPVRGVAKLTVGPLRTGGPHGSFVYFHSSPLITNQSTADQDAQTLLNNLVTNQTIDLAIECLPHPALQIGDWVTVMSPVIDGRQVPLNGRVLKQDLKSVNGTAVDRMTLTVRCSYQDAQTIMQGVNRA